MSSLPFERALAGLPRNARNAIMVEPLWAIFGVVVMYYAPLYMTGVGLSSGQVGLVGSIALAFSLVFQMLAAPITNRFGRKRTTLIWDLVSWTAPMLIWAFTHSLAGFVLAAVLSASGKIVVVSWSLLVIEDVPAADRSKVFGILNLIGAASGLMTPLVGLVIARQGVVPTLRAYYLLGAVGMTVMFLWRNAITDETQNGSAAMREHQDLHPWESLRKNLSLLGTLLSTRNLPWLVGFYVLGFFIEQMNLFQILYFSQTLGFGAVTVSLVPVAVALTSLPVYRLVLPRLSSLRAERALVIACAVGVLGAVLVLLIPVGNLPVMLSVVCVLSVAAFMTRTYRDTVLFHYLPTQGTADLYSAVQVLTMLFSIPAAGIAGAMFAARPLALFVLIALLNLASLVLAWVIAGSARAAAVASSESP